MSTFTFYRSNVVRGAALVSLAALGLGVSASALAASADADATVVQALELTWDTTAPLSFGSVVAGASQGTVTMAANATTDRSCSIEVTCVAQDSGGAAGFTVTGDSNLTYTITVPSSAVTLTESGSTATMDVSGFGHSYGANPGTLTSGSDAFTVGATLNVGAAQAAGDYAGTFDVTVAYE